MKKLIPFILLAIVTLAQTAFSKTFDQVLSDFPVMHAPWINDMRLKAEDKLRVQIEINQNPVYKKYEAMVKTITIHNVKQNIVTIKNNLKTDGAYWKQEVDRGVALSKDPHKAKTGVEMQKIQTERLEKQRKFDTAVFVYKFISEQMPAWLTNLEAAAKEPSSIQPDT